MSQQMMKVNHLRRTRHSQLLFVINEMKMSLTSDRNAAIGIDNLGYEEIVTDNIGYEDIVGNNIGYEEL